VFDYQFPFECKPRVALRLAEDVGHDRDEAAVEHEELFERAVVPGVQEQAELRTVQHVQLRGAQQRADEVVEGLEALLAVPPVRLHLGPHVSKRLLALLHDGLKHV